MKHLLLIFIGFMLLSCSTTKGKETSIIYPQEQLKLTTENLPEEEKNIINDFLDTELETEKYKRMKNLQIVLIEEAMSKTENISAYEYAFNDWHEYNVATPNDNERLGWILDSIQINELKKKHLNVKEYRWKATDIKNHNVEIMKTDFFREILNKGLYVEMPEKLIIYLSRPLIIDKKNALISFASGSSQIGFSEIDHSTVLMKKTGEKWEKKSNYFDGVFH